MTATPDADRQTLLRRGFALEWATLGWNLVGIIVLALAALAARSVALAGFGEPLVPMISRLMGGTAAPISSYRSQWCSPRSETQDTV